MRTQYAGKIRARDRHDGAVMMCCWADCERDGVQSNAAREWLGTDPATRRVYWTWYLFCSERHKMLWVNSHHRYGRLPPGYRLAVT